MENVGKKVEVVNSGIAQWFLNRNKYLDMIMCVTEWYMEVVKETEKAVQVKIWDKHKHQTIETSNWSLWIPKSACGFLQK